MTAIYRVVIRGHFTDLDDPTKETLRREAPDHHFLKSAFTKAGTFTYDEQLVAFNLRYEVRWETDAAGETKAGIEAAIEAVCLERAAEWLTTKGYGHRRLRATLTDMASVWGDR